MIRSVEIQFVKVNCDTLLVDFKFYFARIILRFHFWVFTSLVFTQVLFTIPKFFTFGLSGQTLFFSSVSWLWATIWMDSQFSVSVSKCRVIYKFVRKSPKYSWKLLLQRAHLQNFVALMVAENLFFLISWTKKTEKKVIFEKIATTIKLWNRWSSRLPKYLKTISVWVWSFCCFRRSDQVRIFNLRRFLLGSLYK